MTKDGQSLRFAEPAADKRMLEEGTTFSPRFDAQGLVTAVVTDAGDDMVLMVAHMNAEALSLTLQTGVAHFWSRSRGKLWKKGETSGNTLTVSAIRTDCDQDALWLSVEVAGDGVTCHTERRSCFYREVIAKDGRAELAPASIEPRGGAAGNRGGRASSR